MKKATLILIAAFFSAAVNAQEVITLSQGHNVKTEKVSPVYRPTGSSIRLSIGVPGLITAAYNYQVTPWFMIGGGTGYGMSYYTANYSIPAFYVSGSSGDVLIEARSYSKLQTGYAIPLYFETEFRTPKYKWSAFLNVKMGANIGVKTRYLELPEGRNFYTTDSQGNSVFSETTINWHTFFVSAALGFGYKHFSMGYGLGLQGGKRFGNLFLAYNIPLTKTN